MFVFDHYDGNYFTAALCVTLNMASVFIWRYKGLLMTHYWLRSIEVFIFSFLRGSLENCAILSDCCPSWQSPIQLYADQNWNATLNIYEHFTCLWIKILNRIMQVPKINNKQQNFTIKCLLECQQQLVRDRELVFRDSLSILCHYNLHFIIKLCPSHRLNEIIDWGVWNVVQFLHKTCSELTDILRERTCWCARRSGMFGR